MRRSALLKFAGVAVAVSCVVCVGAGVAYACSRLPLPLVGPGIFGLGRIDGFLFADAGEPQVRVPRNVAFLAASEVFVDETPITTRALGETSSPFLGPFLVADELLPVGAQLSSGSTSAVVDDVEDTTAPSVPAVATGRVDVHEGGSGCAHDSCGDSALLHVAVRAAVDDHTPVSNLVYAIYVATAARAAETMEQPTEFVFLMDGELQTFIDFRFRDHDVFVSVAAMDFAANQSARSTAIRVHRGDSGCSVTHGTRAHIVTWLLCAMALWVARSRAGRRRTASSKSQALR